MPAKKIVSMVVLTWMLGTTFAAATLARGRPASLHFRKLAPRVAKSKGNHRGSQHKAKRRKH